MPFHYSGGLKYYSFQSLDDLGVPHAALTRRGGVSPEPWVSLNVGATVGDEAERVLENRKRSFAALGCDYESLYDVWQVHSDKVVLAEAPRPRDQAYIQADGILTNRPGVTLFMRFADCVPIYLFDPVQKTVGIVHAGWQGTVSKVTSKAIRAMVDRYGSIAKDILAGIGPSIGAHHYPVGPEVASRARSAFGEQAERFLINTSAKSRDTRVEFDLWEANRMLLEQSGVRMIEVAGVCSACEIQDWYSHRAENGKTGRFGALITLPNSH